MEKGWGKRKASKVMGGVGVYLKIGFFQFIKFFKGGYYV